MSLASQFQLHELLGRHVRTTRSLPLLPAGSTGEVVDIYGEKGRPPEIVVQWDEYNFSETFSRERSQDETELLEVVESVPLSRRFCARG